MSTQPREGPRVILLALVSLVWALISGLMFLMAVIGLVSIVFGVLSLFDLTGPLDLQLGGEPVRTTTQKLLFIAVGVVTALLGTVFWVLRQRGHVVGALLCYAGLMGLFLVIAWTCGRADVISVGS